MNTNKKYPGTAANSPLLSWDIFMSHYQELSRLAEDHAALMKIAREAKWKKMPDIQEALFVQKKTLVLTDPNLDIQFASSGIFEMTGYQSAEVVGNRPKMFQGPLTTPASRQMIRESVTKQIPFETHIINYRKDGSIYNCHIKVLPLFNKDEQLVHYMAIEKAV